VTAGGIRAVVEDYDTRMIVDEVYLLDLKARAARSAPFGMYLRTRYPFSAARSSLVTDQKRMVVTTTTL
jgi:hypothetical protein